MPGLCSPNGTLWIRMMEDNLIIGNGSWYALEKRSQYVVTKEDGGIPFTTGKGGIAGGPVAIVNSSYQAIREDLLASDAYFYVGGDWGSTITIKAMDFSKMKPVERYEVHDVRNMVVKSIGVKIAKMFLAHFMPKGLSAHQEDVVEEAKDIEDIVADQIADMAEEREGKGKHPGTIGYIIREGAAAGYTDLKTKKISTKELAKRLFPEPAPKAIPLQRRGSLIVDWRSPNPY